MPTPFTLTLEQRDLINQSLAKAQAIAQMVADCGDRPGREPDAPPSESLMVVMRILADELEKVSDILDGAAA